MRATSVRAPPDPGLINSHGSVPCMEYVTTHSTASAPTHQPLDYPPEPVGIVRHGTADPAIRLPESRDHADGVGPTQLPVPSHAVLARLPLPDIDLLYIVVVDPDPGTSGVVFASRSLTAHLGFRPETFAGLSWRAILPHLLHPDDRPGLERLFADVRGLSDDEIFKADIRVHTAMQTWRHLRLRVRPFARERDGSLSQIGLCLQDITDTLFHHATDRTAPRDAILASMSQGVAILDEHGRCVSLNPAGQRILGVAVPSDAPFRATEMSPTTVGRDLLKMVTAEPHHRLPLGDSDTRVGVVFERPSGERVPLAVNILPQTCANGTSSTLLLFEDLTSRQSSNRALTDAQLDLREARHRLALMHDEAQSADRAVASLLSTLSHEFRTPLNALLGCGELLLDTPLAVDQRLRVGTMIDAGQALLTLVNHLLDLAASESGRLTLATQPFSLRHLLEESLHPHRAPAEARAVPVICDIDPALPRQVRGDPARIRQIVANLVHNAIKFTHQGRVTVSARGVISGSQVRVQLIVEDTGIGMAPDVVERIGRAFHTADSSLTRPYSGSGLGLAIVKRLVDLMHGDLRVQSQLQSGTRVTVELPLPILEPDV